jgi:hypothetical protein
LEEQSHGWVEEQRGARGERETTGYEPSYGLRAKKGGGPEEQAAGWIAKQLGGLLDEQLFGSEHLSGSEEGPYWRLIDFCITQL